jgi:heme A synthase
MAAAAEPALGSGTRARGRRSAFATFAWGVVAYDLAVIAWGAYVRASGSGAGCGSHWPLCNGEVIPRSRQAATLIELTHRVTSGVALALVVVMAAWAFRASPRGSVVRRGAVASLVFMIGEAAIGAALVLLELVAYDESVRRAVAMSLHLVNTFLLLASMALTASWASGAPAPRVRGQGALAALLAAPIAAMLVLGTSGALAALGDTLFPSSSLAAGVAQDFSGAAHLFVRLRALHPLLAVSTAVVTIAVAAIARSLRPSPAVRARARLVVVLVLWQMGAGVLNLVLLAPIPMQLVHLLLADATWMALVLLASAGLADVIPASCRETAPGR